METASIIAQLYYLLIKADGQVDDKEIAMGKKLIAHEKLNELAFENELSRIEGTPMEAIYSECLNSFKKLSPESQVRFIAWMCLIANSDGFMDSSEWKLIYKLYQKELNLKLDDIMVVQRELNAMVNNITFKGKEGLATQ